MSIAGFLGKLTLGIFRFTYVDEGTAKVVTRFGRYRKTLRPGLRGYLSAWGTFGRIHGFTVTDPAFPGGVLYQPAGHFRFAVR